MNGKIASLSKEIEEFHLWKLEKNTITKKLKNTITKFKSSPDGFKDRMQMAEETVSDLEGRAIKINDLNNREKKG